ASFDEAARELTVEAAKRAGLENLTLLEEPQAAFYCWIVSHQSGWQQQVRGGELILVCDIGGGTTDFSLITVVETPTGPGFRRVAVGDHLMLGGDNIDLALAHRVEQKLGGRHLDAEQWSALRQACRIAKEKLLAEDSPPDRWPVTIAGRGSRLIGGSLQSELTRADVLETVVEGFLPRVRRDEEPARSSKLGLQEFGLPFVADPAITRHLSAFLRRHKTSPIGGNGDTDDSKPARPDAILFNGGALTPSVVRERIVEVVSSWFPDEPDGPYRPRVLTNESLDLAVSVGAAYYGVVRRGGGIRIGGGTARAFYVGFESARKSKTPWLCVLPRDAQEGDEIEVSNHDFSLLLDRPVAFPLASSSVRDRDQPGDLVPADPDSIRELPPLVSVMRVGRKAKAEEVPVRLEARVTEVGTVELWCRSLADDRRWRLQIQLRTPESSAPATSASLGFPSDEAGTEVLEQSVLDAASEAIRSAFSAGPNDDNGPSRLVKRLEEALELPRDQWPPSALRSLWEPLLEAADSRFRSPRHESRWLNLAGYFLRPGLGYPLDASRIKALWPTFHAGVRHIKDTQTWVEWWVLWRRVSAGLNRAHHEEIHRRLAPFLQPPRGGSGKKATRPKPEPHEFREMWRCSASLERLPATVKESLGDSLLRDLKFDPLANHVLWCLGRYGARVPLFGPANTVVPTEAATRWAEAILARAYPSNRDVTDAIFALSQIAGVSGDRVRDLAPDLRERVAHRLEALGAEPHAISSVREFQERAVREQGQALGDALPVGLRLRSDQAGDGE
ncbi:MAG TPA: Hsp70 family protein, partial [Isosphaeraceae bacterium]|nr:Hsp70 family protein [Isosphaeraceae bacterium]